MRGEAQYLAPFAFRVGAPARVLLSGVVFLVATLGPTAFGNEQPQSRQPREQLRHGGQVADYAGLVATLRAAGARVEPGGKVVQPFLSVKGRLIKVNGEEVQVFQYRDAARSDAQAALISRSGSTVGTTKLHWLGPPHFYKQGKLLVLYVGEDSGVLKALEAAVGRPFAGKQD